MPDFLDLDPGTVATAGHSTAATSTEWQAWGSRVETLLRTAATDAQQPVVTSAFEEHLATWNPRIHGAAHNAEALGTNATSASTVMVNTDGTSSTRLAGCVVDEHRMQTWLSRPIAQ